MPGQREWNVRDERRKAVHARLVRRALREADDAARRRKAAARKRARHSRALELRETEGFTGRQPNRKHHEILTDRVLELEYRVERLHRERENAKRDLRLARKRVAQYINSRSAD